MKYRRTASQIVSVLAIIAGGLSLTACSETTREEYRDEMTEHACERYFGRCDQVGPGKTYKSQDECTVKVRPQINDMWPANKCDDGRIDEKKFDACMARVSTASCSNLLDWASFLVECRADKVCTAR